MANQHVRNKDEGRPGNPGQAGGGQTGAEAAGGVMERAKEAAAGAARTAGEAASTVGRRVEDAASTVAGGMQSLAGTIREHAPREGVLGTASSTVARTLESSGRYLEQEGLSGVVDDLASLIRRNPIPAVLIGVGLGFLLARTTSRSH
jgi:hypothetical protein